jgi:hypothetical protein
MLVNVTDKEKYFNYPLKTSSFFKKGVFTYRNTLNGMIFDAHYPTFLSDNEIHAKSIFIIIFL